MFDEYQLGQLERRGITPEIAQSAGVRNITDPSQLPEGCPDYWRTDNSYLPGLLFPWTSVDGRVEYQIRPNVPPIDPETKRPKKYAGRGKEDGYEPVLWAAKKGDDDGVVLIVEGTCQTVAAAAYAPEDSWVFGMFGCWGWSSEKIPVPDLAIVADRDVVVAMDADYATNRSVWDAAKALQEAVRAEGARTIRFVHLPTGGKTGLDDYLGSRPMERRADVLARLMRDSKIEKFPVSRQPKAKRQDDNHEIFGDTGLLTDRASKLLRERAPMLLTNDEKIAVYQNGVFKRSDLAFTGLAGDLMGDNYRTHYRSTLAEYLSGVLYTSGDILPDYSDAPMLNCANGMLNLISGEFVDHDPSYRSSAQIPVEWDPEATCPTYEKWLAESAPGQVDDLEETVSTMLDPSRTPAKAVFLFGPSRSGKSTFLRLTQRMAGSDNLSSVTLHQLVENRFMSANVYGRMLNVASDIPAAHLEDISIFKMMTGEDPIQADRKNGKQFSFINRALFAFSANALPTVGEASNAYISRIKPFLFPHSFEGAEDPTIEARMVEELPGILVRWVRAYNRLIKRGRVLPTDETVQKEFVRQSDRVRQFVEECCEIVPADDSSIPAKWTGAMSNGTELAKALKEWAEANNTRAIGRNKLMERIFTMEGVVKVREAGGKRREGVNLRIKPQDDWGASPVAVSQEMKNEIEEAMREPVKTEEKTEVSPAKTEVVPALGDTWDDILNTAQPIPDEAIRCKGCGYREEHVPTEAGELNCPRCFPQDFAWTMDDPMGANPKPETSWPGRRCQCRDCPGGGKLHPDLLGKKTWDEGEKRWM